MKFIYKHTSSLLYIFILIIIILQLTKAERRVLDGRELTRNRNYVVYFIKANDSIQYDAWLCGGAIVSRWYILTSAACVEDVKYMYAIAGYLKYVNYDLLNEDRCTDYTKRKIVFKCLPVDYQFDYPRVERWANIDLALVKVEKPYNFNDRSYLDHCSYIPNKIDINYDIKLQEPGTDAIVFGWGHLQKWREVRLFNNFPCSGCGFVNDTLDYNQDSLLYGPVKLASKEDCMDAFDSETFRSIIEKYMICSLDAGKLDDAGDIIGDSAEDKTFVRDCGPGALRVGGKNDHGGPIITWRGPKEVLIGIASVFKVDDRTQDCVPPFLYTSTHCNGEFIHCLMNTAENGNMGEEDTRRCDALAKQRGFNIIRRTISWIGHPDGPAYNEIDTHNERDKTTNSNVKK
ncbi:uncharacterized protein LOC134657720 [Cydia amplana]|uniref:uncharacterized protein LOC134657720 n=1 Tax=Cydia amplana TaxID=1869771 RepID=UPI002FE6192C